MAPFCSAVLTALLEEMMALNPAKSPAIPFRANQDALTVCEWIGPPMVDADPAKTAKADDLKLNNGSISLVEICANDGRDWRDVLDNQHQVLEYSKDIGLIDLQAEQAETLNPTPEPPPTATPDKKPKKKSGDKNANG